MFVYQTMSTAQFTSSLWVRIDVFVSKVNKCTECMYILQRIHFTVHESNFFFFVFTFFVPPSPFVRQHFFRLVHFFFAVQKFRFLFFSFLCAWVFIIWLLFCYSTSVFAVYARFFFGACEGGKKYAHSDTHWRKANLIWWMHYIFSSLIFCQIHGEEKKNQITIAISILNLKF